MTVELSFFSQGVDSHDALGWQVENIRAHLEEAGRALRSAALGSDEMSFRRRHLTTIASAGN